MPELKCDRLKNFLCKSCDNLSYWDGDYYCSCETLPKDFEKQYLTDERTPLPYIIYTNSISSCPRYEKRKPCTAAPDDYECQFWCKGHSSAPMEPCPYYKDFQSNKI